MPIGFDRSSHARTPHTPALPTGRAAVVLPDPGGELRIDERPVSGVGVCESEPFEPAQRGLDPPCRRRLLSEGDARRVAEAPAPAEGPTGAVGEHPRGRALNGIRRKPGVRIAEVDGDALPDPFERGIDVEGRVVKQGLDQDAEEIRVGVQRLEGAEHVAPRRMIPGA